MPQQQTFVMLKPGVLQRRLVGSVLRRFEEKGLRIVALKLITLTDTLARDHYAEHEGRDFFAPLVEYITSGPVVAMVIEGVDAIPTVRLMTGATKVDAAQPGTIRGDLAGATRKNVIHASDSPQSARREIGLYFAPEEIQPWHDPNEQWLV